MDGNFARRCDVSVTCPERVRDGRARGRDLFSVVVLVLIGVIFRIVPVPSRPGSVVVVSGMCCAPLAQQTPTLEKLGVGFHEAS